MWTKSPRNGKADVAQADLPCMGTSEVSWGTLRLCRPEALVCPSSAGAASNMTRGAHRPGQARVEAWAAAQRRSRPGVLALSYCGLHKEPFQSREAASTCSGSSSCSGGYAHSRALGPFRPDMGQCGSSQGQLGQLVRLCPPLPRPLTSERELWKTADVDSSQLPARVQSGLSTQEGPEQPVDVTPEGTWPWAQGCGFLFTGFGATPEGAQALFLALHQESLG